MIIHGYRRTTGEMEIRVNTVCENYTRLMKAFARFGLPMIAEMDFPDKDEMDVFSFGRSPLSIDILKQVKGCAFDAAFAVSEVYVEADLPVRYIHLQTLLQAEKASGGTKDLDDIEKLSQQSN